MPEFEIGFSPCPNDTFIFDALVNHKIDTKGYTFKVHLQDVQTLNEWAIAGKLPFSKISYGVWPLVKNNYALLNSGGSRHHCRDNFPLAAPVWEFRVQQDRGSNRVL